MGNTHAALTELYHYSRPDTTFIANYDEQGAMVREKSAPFSHCYILTGRVPGSQSGSSYGNRSRNQDTATQRPRPGSSAQTGKPPSKSESDLTLDLAPQPASVQSAFRPYADAAELIRLNLFTRIGLTAEESRTKRTARPPARGTTIATFGISGFGWPRAEIVDRTTAKVARAILRRWAAPDLNRSREIMPKLAQEKWLAMGLDPDSILEQLRESANNAAKRNVEKFIGEITDPLLPRGWLARLPDPQNLATAIERFMIVLGPPSSPSVRMLTPVEEAMSAAINARTTAVCREIHTLIPSLVNDPDYRLSGTEELIRQFLATTDRVLEQYGVAIGDLDAKAVAAFELLTQYTQYTKGMRKPTAVEFTDALRIYPQSRFKSSTFITMVSLYQAVRESLVIQLNEVATARQRLESAARTAAKVQESPEPVVNGRRLMPPGCATLEAAVEKFTSAISDEEFGEIDRRAQDGLDPQLHGIFVACLRSASGPERVVTTVYRETRRYLESRLGEADLSSMFHDRFRSPQQAERAIEETFNDAEPALLASGPWSSGEVAVFACPAGPAGESLRELALRSIPVAGLPITNTPDELALYREWPAVPFSALPHLGPDGVAAFQALTETQQCPAHSRLDVINWHAVEDA
jgi:hypothetical protein